jgi:hypothetical protein
MQVWLVLELCTGGSLKDAVSSGRIRSDTVEGMVSAGLGCRTHQGPHMPWRPTPRPRTCRGRVHTTLDTAQ